MSYKKKSASFSVAPVLWSLRFYKKYLSLPFGGQCRFTPTCSEYLYQQIQKHGTITGLFLGLRRLLSCHG